MKHSRHAAFAAFLAAFAVLPSATAIAALVTLETPSLGAALYDDDWRPDGGFASGGAFFNNAIGDFGTWSGFALSRVTDNTTAGFSNQYSAFPGSGAGGSLQYAVGYEDSFGATPTITLPAGEVPISLTITNATYAALSMKNGDGFAKKFGGTSGTDPDFFRLTITGLDAENATTGSVQFYLADYRDSNDALDYIVNDWRLVNISSLLASTRKLRFTLDSSDNNSFGMKTPAYFAVDNVVTAVPEPAAAALLCAAAGALAFRRKRA